MVRHAQQVITVKNRLEIAPQAFNVILTNPERHNRTNITKNGIANFFGQLGRKLVGYNQVQVILASFTHNSSEAVG